MTPAQLHAALNGVPHTMSQVSEWSTDHVLKKAEQAADTIASGADALWATARLSEIPPDRLADDLTVGLAILAQRPGGVSLAGLHWCATPHPDCAGPGAYTWPESDQARGRGAVYTPRSLADEVTLHALEPLVYRPGPHQTADRDEWQLLAAADILNLKVSDIAVGSGVFLVAACRYLADRVMDAWHAEDVHDQLVAELGDPVQVGQFARALVLTRCLYGADIHGPSVELATLVCALLTPLRPAAPHLAVGDSLLGIRSLEQIEWMCCTPAEARDQLHHGVPVVPRSWIASAPIEHLLLLADLATGAMLFKTNSRRTRRQRHLRAAELAHAIMAGQTSEAEDQAAEWLRHEITGQQHQPLHWPLLFPEVFSTGGSAVQQEAVSA